MRLEDGPRSSVIDWDEASSLPSRRLHGEYAHFSKHQPPVKQDHLINFSGLSADLELCPVDDFRRSVKQALVRNGKGILAYGDHAGYPPLRESIAARMRIHGVSVTPDEIMITNGAQHGIDLALRLLASPGTQIVTEVPIYGIALPLFRFHGVEMIEIPMRDDGMDLDLLQEHLRRSQPALVYTIPNFQNPTGITTNQVHRERLLALCENCRVPILEDGFEEEMKYFGHAVLPIKSMDAGGVVIYLGTFSKVVFPGLRIGWIAADKECIRRLVSIHRFSNLSCSTLGQAALVRFLNGGYYEDHIRRVHRTYRQRMLTALDAMKRYLPEKWVSYTQPTGGYTLWVHVQGMQMTESSFLTKLEARGVLVSPGRLYFPRPHRGIFFRLSIANVEDEKIVEGIRRLGEMLRDMTGTE